MLLINNGTSTDKHYKPKLCAGLITIKIRRKVQTSEDINEVPGSTYGNALQNYMQVKKIHICSKMGRN